MQVRESGAAQCTGSVRMFYQVVTDGFVLKKSSELAGELRGRGGICLIQCMQERGNE